MKRSFKKGTAKLIQIQKEELQFLIDNLSIKKIAEQFGISTSATRRIISERIDYFGITVTDKKAINFRPPQEPFSFNEDDYGSFNSPDKQIITKHGMFVFKGNAPIYKQKNKLSETVKEYVNVMLNNNQPLNFIKQ